MRIAPRRREELDINITPLIDVVFLLLIFFMVSTTFERESELGIELPETSATSEPTRKGYLEVSVDGKGRYYVNGRPLVNTQAATLIKAMRERGYKPEFAAAWETLSRLLAIADRTPPYEFYASLLGPGGGRRDIVPAGRPSQ